MYPVFSGGTSHPTANGTCGGAPLIHLFPDYEEIG
jgi:hypothetical protein